jgi:hypothetical protein
MDSEERSGAAHSVRKLDFRPFLAFLLLFNPRDFDLLEVSHSTHQSARLCRALLSA